MKHKYRKIQCRKCGKHSDWNTAWDRATYDTIYGEMLVYNEPLTEITCKPCFESIVVTDLDNLVLKQGVK